MLQDIADSHWIENPALAPAIQAMIDHQLCFDALVLPRHLKSLFRFAQQFPALQIVIDHAAKPLIADGTTEPWRSDMRRLAALSQVHCKLSGLLTEAAVSYTHLDVYKRQARCWPAVIRPSHKTV